MKKNITLSLFFISILMLFNIANALGNEELMADATADFQSSANLITTGNSVNFLDMTTGSPVSWTWTFDGGTPSTYSGQIPPPVYYSAAGEYSVTLEVMDANGDISTEIKPDYIDVNDYPTAWDVIQTGSSHLISIPSSIIFGALPLQYGDYVGVFYLDETSQEKCGGFSIWDSTNSKVVVAFGDDMTTDPQKEGFGANEVFQWKVFFTSSSNEDTARVVYNLALPNDSTFADNGLSAITSISAGTIVPLSVIATADPGIICTGSSVQLDALASEGTGTYSYSWSSNPAGFSSTLKNPVVTPSLSTDYIVEVNDGANTASDTVLVTVNLNPTASAGADFTLCEGADFTTSGTADDYCSIQWTSDGEGTFSDDTAEAPTYYPSTSDIESGLVELCITAQACDPCFTDANDCMQLTIQKQPTVMVGSDVTVCDGEEIALEANVANYCGLQWTSDGDGVFDNDASLITSYTPGQNDIINGEAELCMTAQACSPCEVSAEDCLSVTIQRSPTASAGADFTLCEGANYTTSGTADDYCSLQWTSDGEGTFSDDTSVAPTYYPGVSDIESGLVELCITAQACDPCFTDANDCMQLTIQKQPTVMVGSDVTVCDGEEISLEASAANYCGLQWTRDGDGVFDNDAALTTNYTPGQNDIINGGVELCMTAQACSPCEVSADDCMSVIIQRSPTASAGENATLCEGDAFTTLGTASDYCSLLWTSDGEGTFSDNTAEAPTYYPSTSDIESGLVELCITAQACDPCFTDANDCMQLTIQKQPTVMVGSDVTVCEGEEIALEANAANYCGLQWTRDGDGVFDNDASLITNYTPGQNDILNGGVELCMTAQACSPCEVSVDDCLSVSIQRSPGASAGADFTLCEGADYTTTGTASDYCSIQWISDGEGTFSDNTAEAPTYYPGASDIETGLVELCITAQACDPCITDANDCMQLTIQKQATVTAGSDVSLCEDEAYNLLDATATNYETLFWTSNGDGTFDGVSNANPTYYPGILDLNLQQVTLTITVSSLDPCVGNLSDDIQISIQPKPIASAGDDAIIPEDESYTNTDATVANYSSFVWDSDGDGLFNDESILNTTYTPGENDITDGVVNLCITAEPLSPCQLADVDCLTLVIGTAPNVFAGQDASVCEGENLSLDQATADNYLSILWETDGDGSFSDASIVNPVYYPGIGDIADGSTELCITAQPNPPSTVVGNNCMILTIEKQPTVSAGLDQTICEGETITLNQTTASNYAQLQWSTTDGSGQFSNVNALKPTYAPDTSDYLLACITLNVLALPNDPCSIAASDDMELCFQLLPQALAGDDFTICETENAQLDGNIENACAYFWETLGNGSFDDEELLNAIYSPGTADIASGSVTLCLTASPCNPCTVEDIDCVTIYLQATPFVNAGEDAVICEDQIFTTQATAENVCGLIWISSGNGQFSNPDEVITQYEPSFDDIENGEITLCITGFPCDPCQVEAEDCITLSIQKLPSAFAGVDATICEGESYQLNDAEVENSESVQWMVIGGNGSFDNEELVNCTYTPGTDDLIAGCIDLMLSATPINPCYAVAMDTMTLCIQKLPEVDAGEDNTVCAGETISLEAEVANYCGLQWTSDGDGSFNDDASAFTNYTPGSNDLLNGGVELCLTAQACSPCEDSAEDCLNIVIQKAVTADAGQDATICEGETYLLADAIAANYSVLQWSTLNGDGTFDNYQSENPVYTPSSFDVQQGCVTLQIFAQAVSPCTINATDEMELCFQPQPAVNAGTDITLCQDENYLLFDANATDYESILWATDGDGTFNTPTFVNPTYYPGSLDLESQQATLTITASAIQPCSGSISDGMQISIQPKPMAFAGNDATISEDETYTLTDAAAAHYSSLAWESGGDGGFDNSEILNPTYSPGTLDIENRLVTLCITATPLDPCTIATNDCMELIIGAYPVISAGADASICEDNTYTFDESVALNYLTILWESSGDGTFSSATAVHPTYYPGEGDLAAGSLEICITAEALPPASGTFSDCMILNIQANPIAYAGPDVTICEGQSFDITDASASNYNFVQWAGISGTGEFISANQVLTTYIPSFLDLLQGTVTLQLAASSIHPCTTLATDQVQLTFQRAPQADAGEDQTLCEDGFAALEGTVVDACGTNWFTSFGDGTFDNSGDLNTGYYPGELDKMIGFVEVCLEAYPCDPCTVSASASDCLILTIQKNPLAIAGSDGVICENENYQLGGSVENACGSLWETQGDGQFSDPGLLNAEYIPGNEDILNGFVEVCLSAQPCNPCILPDSNCLIIEIQNLPSANAGFDATICESDTYQVLGASANNFSAIQWATTGSGSFDNPNGLNPTYFPSFADAILGCVSLQISVQGINPCALNASDTMELCFQLNPVIDAGEDAVICAGESFETMATSENACGYNWTTYGDGAFGNNLLLEAIYTPGSTDIGNGFVEICVTAQACDPCTENEMDCVIISIQAKPTANAGPDDGVLAGNTYLFENAEAESYSSLLWESQGDGLFDDSTTLNPAYTPGEGDIANYQVELCLNALPINPCQVSDQDCMILQIGSMPVITAGPDVAVCAVGEYTLVDATAENYSSIQWSTSGDGTFDDDSIVNPTYFMGDNDIAGQAVELCLNAEPIAPATISTSDCMTLSLVLEPTADAGDNVTLCGNQPYILQATATEYCEIEWTTSGNGVFNDNSLVQPAYTPGAADITFGAVDLCISAIPCDPCTIAANDCMTIFLFDAPSANAGNDKTICENKTASLSGSVSNNCGFYWETEGDGVFNNNLSLSPVYTPGDLDKDNGLAIICLFAEPCDPCTLPVSDCMELTIIGLPQPNPGPDASVCFGDSWQLNATLENGCGFYWQTNGDGNFSNTGSLTTTYNPGTNDYANGSVQLCLLSFPCQPCTNFKTECMTLSFVSDPIVDAGDDVTICSSDSFTLQPTIQDACGVVWVSNGDGTFDNSSLVNATYTPGLNDGTSGLVELCITGLPCGSCENPDSDCMTISYLPGQTADAGADITICEDQTAALDGLATNNCGTEWSSAGDGIFSDFTSLDAVYTPGEIDLENSFVVLTFTALPCEPCNGNVSDELTLTFVPLPEAFAGDDAVIVAGENYEIIGAVVQNASVYNWTTSGDGFFDNSEILSPTYTPGSGDELSGTVDLCLVVQPINPCTLPVTDCMTLSIVSLPTANAGVDATVCGTSSFAIDGASATNYSTILWTTNGDGTFNDSGLENPVYYSGINDISLGSVQLCITTQALPPATQVAEDCMTLSFQAQPEANAGLDATICSGQDFLLSGEVQNACGFEWTTNGDGLFDDSFQLIANYTPGVQDVQNGFVSLCLTAQPCNPCQTADMDCMTLFVAGNPEADAGEDITICENLEYVALEGTVKNACDILWTTSGTGTFDDASMPNAKYYLGEVDINNEFVELCLNVEACAPCEGSNQDCVMISIIQLPVANAGDDWTICEDEIFNLQGSATFNCGLSWFAEGNGSFDDPNIQNPNYTPGTEDIAAGFVNICLEAFACDPCSTSDIDCMTLFIESNPVVYAGDDATICETDSYVMQATVENSCGVQWISAGGGAFDNPNLLNATYTPGLLDILNESVELCLVSQPCSPCNSGVQDCVVLFFAPLPEANAGDDAIVCEGGEIQLNGSVINACSSMWATSGDGEFDNAELLDATYSPGALDAAHGTVELCLEAGACDPCTVEDSDCLTLTIVPNPTANAGDDQVTCETETITLDGSAENYCGVHWTSNGFGQFDDANILNPTYTPGMFDVSLGSVELCMHAQACDPCSVAANDCMALTIQAEPEANAGEDVEGCDNQTVQLLGEAENYSSVQWETSGDGVFDNSAILNPVYSPGDVDKINAGVDLTLNAYPQNPCFVSAVDTMHIGLFGCQSITIPQGWSGISSYLDPSTPELEQLFAPIFDELIILQTMQESWWPSENFNTIGDWNVLDGYKIKVSEEVELSVPGTLLDNQSLALQAGWNLIPVLSSCPVDVEVLFQQTGVIMVKEVAGWKLYWPEQSINTIGELQSGKAYYVYMESPEIVNFPDCEELKNAKPARPNIQGNIENSPQSWRTFSPTAVSHIVGVPSSVFLNHGFEIGDVIGVFDDYNNCFGFTVLTGENINISCFGDDITTDIKDGFDEGEIMNFTGFDYSTGNITDLQVEFSNQYPNQTNAFTADGISLLKSITLNPDNTGTGVNDNVTIYPTLVGKTLNIVYTHFENVDIIVLNIQGQTVYSGKLSGIKTMLDVSGFVNGVYLVQLSGNGLNHTERIIKQ